MKYYKLRKLSRFYAYGRIMNKVAPKKYPPVIDIFSNTGGYFTLFNELLYIIYDF